MSFNTVHVLTDRECEASLCYGKEELTIIDDLNIPKHYAVKKLEDGEIGYTIKVEYPFGADEPNIFLAPADEFCPDPKDMVGPMFDGYYAEFQYNQFIKKFIEDKIGYKLTCNVIKIHDRFETWDVYEALSR